MGSVKGGATKYFPGGFHWITCKCTCVCLLNQIPIKWTSSLKCEQNGNVVNFSKRKLEKEKQQRAKEDIYDRFNESGSRWCTTS